MTPVFNESEGLVQFYSEVKAIVTAMKIEVEIIFVDDGSSDESWKKISKLVLDNVQDRLIGIRLDRNYGQMVALEAGMREAKGDYILTLDSDLQHPPSIIPDLWRFREEFEVVQGRQVLRSEGIIKSKASHFFYTVLNKISGVQIQKNVGDFRLLNKATASFLLRGNQSPKILRFMIPKYKINTREIEFHAAPRRYGESKYGFRKLLSFGLLSIVKTTTRPLYLSVFLSIFFLISFCVEFVFVIYSAIWSFVVPGWASLVSLLSAALAAIFGILGIFGIYLAHLIEITDDSSKFRIAEVFTKSSVNGTHD